MALYLPRRLDLGWPQTINQVRRISVGVYPKKTPLCPTSGVSANCLQYSQVYFNVKGKAIHVRAISDPERSRMCRLHQISRQSAHEGGKTVSPTHQLPLLPQVIFLVLISVRGWVDARAIVGPTGLWKWKVPMTPSGIEPTIFRLVESFVRAVGCVAYLVLLKCVSLRTHVSFKHYCTSF